MCSPDSSVIHWTSGSDFDKRFSPSTNFGKSLGFFGSTATLTTAATVALVALTKSMAGTDTGFTNTATNLYY
jgi:hypothetical protein